MVERKPQKRTRKETAAPAVPAPLAGVPTFEEVTPATAQQWLVCNVHNRPLRGRTVDTLAAAIRRDEWVVNGDMIRFADDGSLIDGQHRLYAVIAADRAVWTWVIRGLPQSTQETIDIGAHRGYHDILSLRGEGNAIQIAAVLVWAFRLETLQIRSMRRKPSNGEKDDILNRHPEIRDSVAKVNGWATDIPMPRSLLGLLHWQLSLIDEDNADMFFGRLADGVNLDEGNPIRLLRQMLFNWARSRDKIEDYVKYAYTVLAWNYWRAGQKRQLLAWKRGTMAIPVPK